MKNGKRKKKALSSLKKVSICFENKTRNRKKLNLQISFSKSRLDKYLNINIQFSEKMLQYLKF